jgi:hypothetical protein
MPFFRFSNVSIYTFIYNITISYDKDIIIILFLVTRILNFDMILFLDKEILICNYMFIILFMRVQESVIKNIFDN